MKTLKRILCYILIVATVMTCDINFSDMELYASASTPKIILTVDGTEQQLYVKSGTTSDYPSAAYSIAYGENYSLSISGADFDDGILYYRAYESSASSEVDPDNAAWIRYSLGDHLKPGKYFVSYVSESKGACEDTFALTVQKAKLATPDNLTFSAGGIAAFDPVTQDTDGNSLISIEVSYRVDLYKDNTKLESAGASVTTKETSVDFSAVLGTSYGNYTFKVTALSSDSACYDSSAEATVSSSLDYKDAIDPVISAFAGDQENGCLTATASDAQTGISGYAFTTKTREDLLIDSDWQTGATFTPTAAGTYYLYVKDGNDNIACAANTVDVTLIHYEDYYSSDTKQTKSLLLFDDVASVTPDTDMLRATYDFKGWFTEQEYTNEVKTLKTGSETSLTGDVYTVKKKSEVTLYARWTAQEYKFKENPAALNITYDGTAHSINAEFAHVTTDDGKITFQWYKLTGENQASEVSADRVTTDGYQTSLKLETVADSGTYYVEGSCTVNGEEKTATSSSAIVTIGKADLHVAIDSQSLTYMDEKPAFTYTLTDATELRGGDTADSIGLSAIYTTGYAKGSPVKAGGYAVSGVFTADNYTVTATNGTIYVAAKDVSTADADVSLFFDGKEASYSTAYTSSEIEPTITAYDGDTAIDSSDIDSLVYADNVYAGTAKATVNFKNNYTGSLEINFTIEKADRDPDTVKVDFARKTADGIDSKAWTYGNTASETTVVGSTEDPEITIYYKEAGKADSTATTTMPTNAGNYVAYAKLSQTANYKAFRTEDVDFEIEPVVITFTANSLTVPYDGTAHSDYGYTMTGEFVGSDYFKSVTVEGKQTDVGESDNAIHVVLSDTTLASNYDIREVKGTLKVTALELPVPSNIEWGDTAGQVTWLSVYRKSLSIGYELQLYRYENGGYTEVGDPVKTSSTSYNFLSAIKEDAAAHPGAGYAVTVKTLPTGGSLYIDYSESTESDKISTRYTVCVSTAGGEGVDASSLKINGASSAILFQGETASLAATVKTGFTQPDWQVGADYTGKFTFTENTVTVSATADLSTVNRTAVVFSAVNSDEEPVIETASSANDQTSSYQKVRFSFRATDTLELDSYVVTQIADQASLETAINNNSLTMTSFTAGSTDQTVSTLVDGSEGTFYIWIKDSADNYVRSSGFEVYKISFAGGTGATGSMDPVYKVKNDTLVIPNVGFTYTGFMFKDWVGSNGNYYSNHGSYAANESITMTAEWTDQLCDYTANYYLMKTDGTYDATPTRSQTFSAKYGVKITTADTKIQLENIDGFELDTDRASEFTMTESGSEINVYYKRKSHTITYQWTATDGSAKSETETYLYGQSISARADLSEVGYTFSGWNFGSLVTLPATMPDEDIVGTGTLAAEKIKYYINYWYQDSDNALVYANSETYYVEAYTGATVSCSAASRDGYEFIGMTTSYGGASSERSGIDSSTVKSATATAGEGQELHFNLFYTPKGFTITLKVYKDNRDGDPVYTYTYDTSFAYGQTINKSLLREIETHGQDNWMTTSAWAGVSDDDKALYYLVDYADWSSGEAWSKGSDGTVKMPNGDITVTRELVKETTNTYNVELYYEELVTTKDENGRVKSVSEGADGGYYPSTPKYVSSYTATVNSTVKVGCGDAYDVNCDDLPYVINTYYEVDTEKTFGANSYLSDTVPMPSSGDSLTFKVYFKRKSYQYNINYYYYDQTSMKYTLIESLSQTGKWGSSYEVKPLKNFDSYKNQEWVLYYDGHYYKALEATGDGHYYPGYKFTKASDITNPDYYYLSYVGTTNNNDAKTTSNIMNVYYCQADISKHYNVNVRYQEYGASTYVDFAGTAYKEDKSTTLTYSHVKVANSVDIFDCSLEGAFVAEDGTDYGNYASWKETNDYETYPGSYTIKGTYSSSEDLRSGFEKVYVLYNGNYYTYYYNSSENTLYVPDYTNQFFYGNRTSYNYLSNTGNPAKAAYSESAEAYLTALKDADTVAPDAYVHNPGFSSTVFTTSTQNYTFSIYNNTTYTVHYYYEQDEYAKGGYKWNDSYTIGCSSLEKKVISGYQMVWYTKRELVDGLYEYSNPVTIGDSKKIQGNVYYYGRAEKAPIQSKEYLSYELVNSDFNFKVDSYYFVTASNYSKVTWTEITSTSELTDDGYYLLKTAGSDSYTGVDGVSTVTQATVIENYYVGKQLAMVINPRYTLSKSLIHLDYSEYESNAPGFEYDGAYTGNSIDGYVQDKAINLSARFVRLRYYVNVFPMTSDATKNNYTSYEMTYGQKFSITNPTRSGYDFAGWTVTYEGSDYTVDGFSDGIGTTNRTSFDMPALATKETSLTLKAKWTPATFDKTIYYYFQKADKSYQTDIPSLKTDYYDEDQDTKVLGSSDNFKSTVYYTDATKAQISLITLVNSSVTYYFETGTLSDGILNLKASDALGASRDFTGKTTDVQEDINNYYINATLYNIFEYAFTTYKYGENSAQYTDLTGVSILVGEEMDLAFYFERTVNNVVTVAAMASDGGSDSGAVVSGNDTYMYGATASISAKLSTGYTGNGWYDADDVLDESGNLKTGWASETPISTNLSYSFTVRSSVDYVYITSPESVVGEGSASVTVSGKQNYEYGYKVTDESVIKARVTLSGVSDNTSVTGYHWYITDSVGTHISELQDSSGQAIVADQFLFPAGKEADDYFYVCEVTLKRSDNGRELTVSSAPFQVTVSPADTGTGCLTITNYLGTYDGKSHTGSVTVSELTEYTLYYSASVLTSANYNTAGSTDILKYKDAGHYQFYFYLKSNNKNYKDADGTIDVRINQKQVKAVAGSDIYTKIYDGLTQIPGSLTDTTSEKYKFSTGNYVKVEGIVASESPLFDFDAAYNNAHVKNATSIDLSNLKLVKLVDGALVEDTNYTFGSQTSFSVSGIIDPYPLYVAWGTTTSFVYNGAEQGPSVTLVDEDGNAILDSDTSSPVHNGDLTVNNKQINVSTDGYTASVGLKSSASYDTGDFAFDETNSTKKYWITKRPLTVTPEDKTVTYDGSTHSLTTLENTGLVTGHTVTTNAFGNHKNAGTYPFTVTTVKVTDSNSRDVTSNYNITMESGTLTIEAKVITVTGITAKDKAYDGNTDAELDLSAISFVGIETGDSLSLDAAKVSGTFAQKDAGSGISVAIAYEDDALSGDSKDNYTLSTATSQQTTSASISKLTVTVTPDDQEAVYGEHGSVAYSHTYTVSYDDGSLTTANTKPTFVIKKDGATVDTSGKLAVGTYDITVDVSGLSATNYDFAAGDAAELTISKRKVAITGVASGNTKVYDGTTTVSGTTADLTTSNYTFETDNGVADSGMLAGDNLTLASYTASYNAAAVASATTITASDLTLGGTDSGNYELSNTSFDFAASITKAPLSLVVDNVTASYGDAASDLTYTATLTGYVNGEGTDDDKDSKTLENGSGITLACDYGSTGYTDVGTYAISASNYTESGNYELNSNSSGTLTVEKAEITVTAEDKTFMYAKEAVPAYTWKYSGWKYSEDETTAAEISGLDQISAECKTDGVAVTTNTLPGTYTINLLNVDQLSAKNYTFTAKSGNLVVDQQTLVISGITVDDKVYDGSDDATEKLNYSTIKFECYYYDSGSGNFVKSDTRTLAQLLGDSSANLADNITVTGTYEDANVGTDKEVSLTIALTGELDKRYTLSTDSQDQATGNITAKDIALTVQYDTTDCKILYGTAFDSSKCQIKDAGSDLVGTETVSGNIPGISDVTFTTSPVYSIGSDVGNYTISASAYSNPASSNYRVTAISDGTLTVTQNKLATPTASWSTDSSKAGTVTWSAVANIGKVKVASYTVCLYKDGSATPMATETVSYVDGQTDYSYDFASVIRNSGKGSYTASVQAIASLTDNAGNKNVADSEKDQTEALKAAKISVAFATDTDTSAATSDASASSILVGGAASYTLLEGEKVSLSAAWKNSDGYKTGYEVDSLTICDTLGSAATGIECSDTVDSSATGSYSTKLAITGATFTDDAVVTLTLKARAATLTGQITRSGIGTLPDKVELSFGYSSDEAPTYTRTVDVAASDNVTTAAYDYTYQWYIGKSIGSTTTKLEGATSASYTFETGKEVYNYYCLYCDVTATRKDNGQSTSYIAREKNYRIAVTRASLDIDSIKVNMTGWTYGDKRNAPSPSKVYPGMADPVYYYKKAGEADTTETTSIPTDAGSYSVRAKYLDNTSYEDYTTAWTGFTISANKLGTPDNLKMVSTENKIPYGTLKWDAVEGPKENAGDTGTASSITVSYELSLYRKNDAGTFELLKTYTDIATNSCDCTDQMTKKGDYKFTVKAVSDNTANCADGDPASSGEIGVSPELNVEGATEIDAVNAVVKRVYDGQPIRIYVDNDAEDVTYNWYKDGVLIASNTKEVKITYVEENGYYSCKTVRNGVEAETSSSYLQAVIVPRAITLVSADGQKIYDGTALEDQTWKILDLSGETYTGGTNTDSVTLTKTGDTVSANVTGSVTDATAAAGTANTIDADSVVIKKSGKTLYSSTGTDNNYVVTLQEGSLKVSPRDISLATNNVTASLGTYDADYDKTEKKPEVTGVTDGVLSKTLTEDTDFTVSYSNNVQAGENTAKAIVTGKGNYTGTIELPFTINKRSLTVTGTGTKTKVYDGNAKTAGTTAAVTDADYSFDQLIAGDDVKLTGYTAAFDSKTAGDSKTVNVSGAALSGSDSSNYTLTNSSFALSGKITKRDVTIHGITAKDKDYDGTASVSLDLSSMAIETVVTGDDVSVNTAKISASFADEKAGDGKAVSITIPADTLEGADSANYNLVVADSQNATSASIRKLTVVITPDNKEKVYDQTGFTTTFSYSGILDSEKTAFEAGSLTNGVTSPVFVVTPADGVSSYGVGTYTIKVNVSQLQADNYTFKAGAAATGVITPRDVTVYGINQDNTKVYDKTTKVAGTSAELTDSNYGFTGLLSGDSLSLASFDSAYNSANVKEANTISVTGAVLGGASKANYKLANTSFTVAGTITKADQVITAPDVTVDYDGKSHSIKATTTGDGSISYSNNAQTEIGTYTVSITAPATDNCNAASASATLTIRPVDMTCTSTGYTGVFDGLFHTIQVNPDLADAEIYYSETEIDSDTDLTTLSDMAPKYRAVGEYTVYFCLTADNHNNYYGSNTVKITEADPDAGNKYIEVDVTGPEDQPVEVKLMVGNKIIAETSGTIEDLEFIAFFNDIPYGNYDIVVTSLDYVETIGHTVDKTSTDVIDVTVPASGDGLTNSYVTIKSDNVDLIVDGLNDLFENDQIYTAEDENNVENNQAYVSLEMVVKQLEKDNCSSAIAGKVSEDDKVVGYDLDVMIDKYYKGQTDPEFIFQGNIYDTSADNILMISFPLSDELKGKSGLTIYREHVGEGSAEEYVLEEMTKLDAVLPLGTSYTQEGYVIEDGMVYIYSHLFSEYVIAYDKTKDSADPDEPDKPSDSDDSARPVAPKTGDVDNRGWMLFFLAGFVFMAAGIGSRKKRRDQ